MYCLRTGLQIQLNLTLEFVCSSYDSQYLHVDLSILGILFSHPPPHSEQEVAGREAVATQRVAERVLRPETQLKPPVGVSVSLWDLGERDTLGKDRLTTAVLAD